MTASIRPSGPEVVALVARAARGAGFDWGLADECGAAAGWLAARGAAWWVPVLRRLDGPPAAAPEPARGLWAGMGTCGLRAGVALAEFAALPEGPRDGLVLSDVHAPGLIAPFAARAAATLGIGLRVVVGDAEAARVGPAGGVLAAGVPGRGRVTLTPCAAPAADGSAPRRAVPAEAWRRLEALALWAAVPASARSARGAGPAD